MWLTSRLSSGGAFTITARYEDDGIATNLLNNVEIQSLEEPLTRLADNRSESATAIPRPDLGIFKHGTMTGSQGEGICYLLDYVY